LFVHLNLEENLEQLSALFFLGVFICILTAASAHMVGGRKWSGWVIGIQIRIARWLIGAPIILAGTLLLAVGKAVKGGKAPRLPSSNRSRSRRNSHA
jgi:hypothetical protein